MRRPTERRWVPWLNGVRRTTSHSTSTRPRSWWWITGDRAENTHPSTIDKKPCGRVTAYLSSRGVHNQRRISHGLPHRCSAEEGTSSSLLPETAEEVWNEPQNPQVLLHLHCGEQSWPAVSPPGMETAPLATAGLWQRVVRTARHIVGGELPPSRISTPGGVYKESPEDYQRLQPPVPQTALSAALRTTFPQHPIPAPSRLRDSFFPQAIRLWTVTITHLHHTPLTTHAMHCTLTQPFGSAWHTHTLH